MEYKSVKSDHVEVFNNFILYEKIVNHFGPKVCRTHW